MTWSPAEQRRRDEQRGGAKEWAGAAAGVGAPFGVIACWALDSFVLPEPMPGAVAGAVFVIASGLAAWVVRIVRRKLP